MPAPRAQLVAPTRLSTIIADEKAHKDGRNVKGAGGRFPCSACVNIHSSSVSDDFFVNYKVALPHQFQPCSDAYFWEKIDYMEAQWPSLNAAEKDELEKNMGINYDPDSLVFDRSLRQYYAPVTSTYIDFMHTICGSGGTAQFHINSFCCELGPALGMTFNDMDMYAQDFYNSLVGVPYQRTRRSRTNLSRIESHHVCGEQASCTCVRCVSCRSPASVVGQVGRGFRERLPRMLYNGFFANRLRADGAHIKAFAGECMSAVFVLVNFCKERLDADGLLKDHSVAMQTLGAIIDILSLHDEAAPFAPRLKDLFVEHHQLVTLLYGDVCLRVKTHLSYHIADSLKHWGVLLDCFSCERRNRLLKAACAHSQSHAGVERSALERLVLDMFDKVSNAECLPFCLRGSVSKLPHLIPEFAHLGNVVSVTCGKWMRTPIGAIRKGTVFAIRWATGRKTVLTFDHAVDVRMLESLSKPRIFIYANIYVGDTAGLWSPLHESGYFEASMISDVLPAKRFPDGRICPIWKCLD
jgi:hypothetical protein